MTSESAQTCMQYWAFLPESSMAAWSTELHGRGLARLPLSPLEQGKQYLGSQASGWMMQNMDEEAATKWCWEHLVRFVKKQHKLGRLDTIPPRTQSAHLSHSWSFPTPFCPLTTWLTYLRDLQWSLLRPTDKLRASFMIVVDSFTAVWQ